LGFLNAVLIIMKHFWFQELHGIFVILVEEHMNGESADQEVISVTSVF